MSIMGIDPSLHRALVRPWSRQARQQGTAPLLLLHGLLPFRLRTCTRTTSSARPIRLATLSLSSTCPRKASQQRRGADFCPSGSVRCYMAATSRSHRRGLRGSANGRLPIRLRSWRPTRDPETLREDVRSRRARRNGTCSPSTGARPCRDLRHVDIHGVRSGGDERLHARSLDLVGIHLAWRRRCSCDSSRSGRRRVGRFGHRWQGSRHRCALGQLYP